MAQNCAPGGQRDRDDISACMLAGAVLSYTDRPVALQRVRTGDSSPMTRTNIVDIMMVGHFAKDLLVVDGRAEAASGGGVYYGSIALRRLGLSVAVVTRLHPADFHSAG